MRIGYFLSCEEYSPSELVEQARLAEEAGFEALWISDHFHPWNDEQGQSPFVWGVIGALSQVCDAAGHHGGHLPDRADAPGDHRPGGRDRAPSCSTGRFTLGVGTGEALNEHVLGDRWPTADVRLEMLEEAVEVMRALWTGDFVYHHGTALHGRERPDLHPARRAAAESSCRRSGRRRSTWRRGSATASSPPSRTPSWSTQCKAKAGRASRPRPATRSAWRRHRGRGRRASRTGCGPTPGCPASCPRCCRRPKHFEQASELVTEEMTRESTVCGSDVDAHVEAFQPYADAGFDEVYIANMGPHYRDFFTLYGE